MYVGAFLGLSTTRTAAPTAIGPQRWWAHQDLNLEPTDYESAALTVELWARGLILLYSSSAAAEPLSNPTRGLAASYPSDLRSSAEIKDDCAKYWAYVDRGCGAGSHRLEASSVRLDADADRRISSVDCRLRLVDGRAISTRRLVYGDRTGQAACFARTLLQNSQSHLYVRLLRNRWTDPIPRASAMAADLCGDHPSADLARTQGSLRARS